MLVTVSMRSQNADQIRTAWNLGPRRSELRRDPGDRLTSCSLLGWRRRVQRPENADEVAHCLEGERVGAQREQALRARLDLGQRQRRFHPGPSAAESLDATESRGADESPDESAVVASSPPSCRGYVQATSCAGGQCVAA